MRNRRIKTPEEEQTCAGITTRRENENFTGEATHRCRIVLKDKDGAKEDAL